MFLSQILCQLILDNIATDTICGFCQSCKQIVQLVLAGIPVAKHGRGMAPTPAVPNLDTISLSQAQIANPEMLFKVNNTAKYELTCVYI